MSDFVDLRVRVVVVLIYFCCMVGVGLTWCYVCLGFNCLVFAGCVDCCYSVVVDGSDSLFVLWLNVVMVNSVGNFSSFVF